MGREVARRAVLKSGLGLGAAAVAAQLLPFGAGRADAAVAPSKPPKSADDAAPRDYADRATYDELEAALYATPFGDPSALNENDGALAWGQSYVMQSYLTMYRATGDTHYLDLVVRNGDKVLATRDNVRGVADYRGISGPVWRAAAPYTAGEVNIADADGNPLVQIRSALLVDTNQVAVTIAAGSAPDLFDLTVSYAPLSRVDSFSDLSMDPASPAYVVTKLRALAQTRCVTTARDLRDAPAGSAVPAPGQYQMTAAYYVFGAHTGMISSAFAEFAAVVRSDARLRHAYGQKARVYECAAAEAVAFHDDEWRENSSGEGWYVFRPGSPYEWDGAELPNNQYLALARTHIHLYRATSQSGYLDRATKMLRSFQNEFAAKGTPTAAVWSYSWSPGWAYRGWTAADNISQFNPAYGGYRAMEDNSHGSIDVEVAVLARQQGVVLTDADLTRLGGTYTENIMAFTTAGVPTGKANVDGSGTLGVYDAIIPRWSVLSPWDARIFEHNLAIMNYNQWPGGRGYFLASVAALVLARSLQTNSRGRRNR